MAGNYYSVGGKRVPGVTTVTSNLGWSAQGLKIWANREGLAGRDILRGDSSGPADVGKLAHAMIEADIRGEELDLSSIKDIGMLAQVEKILERWKRWKRTHFGKPLLVEEELTHDALMYGGRLDMLLRHRGDRQNWIVDLKTGGIYAEQLVQVAGYAMMVEHATRYKVQGIAILRIPRDSDTIQTLERPWDPQSDEAKVFMHCLSLHKLHKTLKREV